MLSASHALVAIAALATASSTHVLRDETWTAPSEHLAHDLTHAPGECLAPNAGAEVELGRALFRSSALLGGPVARMGMSCQSCHSNGRTNARFFLPELTDRAGAADVTSEWSSAVRGDGVMNPRLIPDLADVGRKQRFGSNGETSLRAFVRSVIVEEFQGAPPSDRTLDAILAYLRALDGTQCQQASRISLAHAADDVRRALSAAQASARAGDAASASLALLATQESVGRIVERLPARRFARERRALENLARELGAARDASESAISPSWSARFDATVARLSRRERFTYFNERVLAATLAQ